MHANPNNGALSNRYFSGAEQDAIDQQIAPETPEFWHAMALLAQKGLRELATFDRDRMTEAERVSTDLMQCTTTSSRWSSSMASTSS
jgi:hypothetical protein